MATIREIAKAAGVSIGTVSNFLNDPALVAEETRERIDQVIRERDYHPKAAARSLKSRSTRRIGLVPVISPADNRGPGTGDRAFLELLAGLNTVAAENGFDILISAATDPVQELATYRRVVGASQVDGLVVMGIRPQDERLEFLLEKNFPFVAYGRSDLEASYSFVDVDGAAGMAEAIDHLASIGHRRIAYITPSPTLMCTSQRLDGFRRALAANGLPLVPHYVLDGDFSERAGIDGAERLLQLAEPPTAILTSNDVCAFGVLHVLQEHGLVAGSDMSVVGFDDLGNVDNWLPSLTTIAQPFRVIGFELMQTLLAVLAGEPSALHRVLDARLVVRSSTGPPHA